MFVLGRHPDPEEKVDNVDSPSIVTLHEELNKTGEETSDDTSDTVAMFDKEVLERYYSCGSLEMEAWRLIVDSKQYLDDNVNTGHVPWSSINRTNIREKVATSEKFIGIKRDGNPVALNIPDKIFHRNYKQKLMNKIAQVCNSYSCPFAFMKLYHDFYIPSLKVRKEVEKITLLIKSYGINELEQRDVALTRAFILEQFTSFKRHVLEKEFFPDGHNVVYVRPIVWVLAYALVICSMMFFLYWTLSWGVQSGGTTMNAWGMNFLIGFVQSLVWLRIVDSIVSYFVLNLSIKPQLNAIKRILHQTSINYIQNTDSDVKYDIQVLPHLSPACRVARTKYCYNLFSAVVLRNLNDRDIIRCQTEGKLNFKNDVSAHLIKSIN